MIALNLCCQRRCVNLAMATRLSPSCRDMPCLTQAKPRLPCMLVLRSPRRSARPARFHGQPATIASPRPLFQRCEDTRLSHGIGSGGLCLLGGNRSKENLASRRTRLPLWRRAAKIRVSLNMRTSPQTPGDCYVGTKKSGKGRRKIGRKKRRMRSKIRHRK